jgi:hypothetical protein
MSDYPANATPNPPPPVSSDLRVYIDAGGNVWGRDYATGIGYLLSSTQGGVALAQEPVSGPSTQLVSELAAPDGSGSVRLDCVTGGDLVATSISGPNAGKSVNLTYGRWA